MAVWLSAKCRFFIYCNTQALTEGRLKGVRILGLKRKLWGCHASSGYNIIPPLVSMMVVAMSGSTCLIVVSDLWYCPTLMVVKQVLQSRTNPTFVPWKGGAVSQLLTNLYFLFSFLLVVAFLFGQVWVRTNFSSSCHLYKIVIPRSLEFLILVVMHGFTGRIGFTMGSIFEVAENTRTLTIFKHKQLVT